jgi:predicted dehydrogenase
MPTIRLAVIGVNHDHVYQQARMLVDAGAIIVSFFADEPDLAASFSAAFPLVRRVGAPYEILEDESIDLVVSAAIPNERAAIGIATMLHGKDFLVSKPGCTSLAQLAEVKRVQASTGRIFSGFFGEHFASRAAVKAGELVQNGAIGRVVHTLGLGPHRARIQERPSWFVQRSRYGGILTDLASHQIEQFLFFSGSTSGHVVSSRVANHAHAGYPEFEDFGDVLLAGDGGTGYARVDWLTPRGLDTWGDSRMTILGTDGYIELRKTVDLAGRSGGDHLFLVDHAGTRYIDCRDVPLPFAKQLIADVVLGTRTSLSQERCFLASELALRAQALATRLT